MSQELQAVILAIISPLITAILKWAGLENRKNLIPYICAAIAGLLAFIAELSGMQGVLPTWVATAAGIAGVGLRELYDRLKKMITEQPTNQQ